MAKRKIESVVPFLTFQGRAQEALDFYTGIFPAAKVTGKVLFGRDEGGIEGNIKQAILTVGGNRLRVFDGPVVPGFHFSSAISLFVEINYRATLDKVAEALGKGGEVMMPLDSYPFADRFTWLSDRFGVNWQLVLGPKV